MQDVLYWNSPPPSERRIVMDMETRSDLPMHLHNSRLSIRTGWLNNAIVIQQDMSRYDSSMMDQLIQARRSQHELLVQVDDGGQYHFLGALGLPSTRITRKHRNQHEISKDRGRNIRYRRFIIERDSHG